MTNYSFPTSKLTSWFLKNQRSLPWRETTDPYAIWVSEIMLQQTQVTTVLPYFNNWMSKFPTLSSLAQSPIEEVIKLWEGLGYYSRARNLHAGAQEILSKFGGIFPSSTEDLLSIKGIGPYTKGAIQSFAFHLKSILIDGNVKRVFARFFALDLDFSVSQNHKMLESIAETVLPSYKPWIFNEALMELGALVCTPQNPNCAQCPLKDECKAKLLGKSTSLPVKPKRKKITLLYRAVFVLYFEKSMMLGKRSKGLMQDLYEFPYREVSLKSHKAIEKEGILTDFLDKASTQVEELPVITHSFTHHRVTLFPFRIFLKEPLNLPDYQWVLADKASEKPFSAGHRKIFHSL
ncbi:MAG: Adenine DNA glycosylase [Chlamydiae bacterium]|nr:Adenine DNA glycosylase [Chlamydiota bacterium]